MDAQVDARVDTRMETLMETRDLDRVRGAALDRIAAARRKFRYLIVGAGAVEALFLVLVLEMADLSDQLHLLILFSAFLIYGTLGMCVLALGGYVNLSTQRILKSLELLHRDAGQE